jgi:signal transduction histidine kinase
VDDIVEEVDRIERLVRELLDYTSPVALSIEPIDPQELLERVMCRGCSLRNGGTCGAKGCSVSVADDAPQVFGDPVLLEQVLINLLTNACESGPGPVDLRAERDPDGGARLSVLDRGCGIPDAETALVFEPFYTRKATGTGLGLPMVQRIAELHRGFIQLEPRAGGGTIASLHIPAQPQRETSDEPNPGS